MRQRPGPARCRSALTAALLGFLTATGGTALCQEDRIAVGYEYATWLGTGGYRVGDRDVFILHLPFQRFLRRPTEERFGIRILLPVTIGWLETDTVVSEDVQTLTAIPGLELDYGIGRHWRLKPYFQIGLGKDFSHGDTAYIGAAGVKSKYSRDYGDYTFSLGNALVVAGSRPEDGGDSTAFTRFDAGVSVYRPVELTLARRRARLGAFYIASFFADDANVLETDRASDEIGTVHTFGLSVGVERPVRFLGINIEWLGLSYLSGQGLTGVRLNTGFPF